MYRFILFLALIILFLPGCSRKEMTGSEITSYLVEPPAPPMQEAAKASSVPQGAEAKVLSAESKIIKTAHIEFQVKDIGQSKKRIRQLVSDKQGYISNLEETNDRERIQASFTIRVPAGSFDSLVESILEEGSYVGNVSIERKDVTEEFLDLKARMDTQKALESRYREILRQSRSVEEILKVEEALARLREEIEAKEGRMNYLAHQAEYSTIHARAYQLLPYSQPPRNAGQGFGGRLASALADGWNGLVDFMFDLIAIWPALIILYALYYLMSRWVKRRKLRKAAATRHESA